MKIAIFGQFYHENSEKYIQIIFQTLHEHQVEIWVENAFLDTIKKNKKLIANIQNVQSFKQLDTSFDFFLSIGGDGTILKSITFVRDLEIPIIGINTGRLGFLSTIHKEDISNCIQQIISGEYTLSERSLLTIKTLPEGKKIIPLNFALNEVAVNRKNTTSMIKVETKINGNYLTSYWSDGLIVSTPTGSTGYSLSCGGPVIDPNTSSIVLTPIAPHNLSARPLVIPDDCTISLKVTGREKSYLVSLDSRIETLQDDTTLIIKKAPFTIKMVQLKGDSFIKTLREKLLWGKDKRN